MIDMGVVTELFSQISSANEQDPATRPRLHGNNRATEYTCDSA